LLTVTLIAASALTAVVANANTTAVARWDFNVYLGDKKLGRHTFEVVEENGTKRVVSEADFVYKILFVPAYRYEHTNAERWANNCLLEFEARTNDNGTTIRAFGEKNGDSFEVVGADGPEELPECVMTFAYWNPSFLEQQRLLNPQSGEYVEVAVERLPQQMLEVRGEEVPAQPYRLMADGLELTVWYSTDDRWLGLESVADGGKVLRYVLA
jgi:hypothetical protein